MKKSIIIVAASLLYIIPSYAEWKYMGDANNSGDVDNEDVAVFTNIILEKQDPPKDISLLDMNGDNKITIADLVLLVDVLNGKQEKTKVWVPETIPVEGGGGFD